MVKPGFQAIGFTLFTIPVIASGSWDSICLKISLGNFNNEASLSPTAVHIPAFLYLKSNEW